MVVKLTTQEVKIVTGVIWLVSIFVFWLSPINSQVQLPPSQSSPLGMVVTCNRSQVRGFFPWQIVVRFKKLAWKHYKQLRDAHRQALRMARMSKVALTGVITISKLVDMLTFRQRHYNVGSLPVMYALLETIQVRQIINRHCPTGADIDHGRVAIVMILCRQTCPKPLYKVSDWYSKSYLSYQMGIKAEKLNDDRLGRMLEAISEHQQAIWQEIVHEVLLRTDVDMSVAFYDLSAFVAHGAYKESEYIDYGFAHNTPSNKKKFKIGLNTCSDGNLPLEYRLLNGRTADTSTVEENMKRFATALNGYGCPTNEVMTIGDRAMLNDQLALAYDQHGFRYLAGLKADKTVHKELLTKYPSELFDRHPLTKDGQYCGIPCSVPFEHNDKKVSHRGLVVLSKPMKVALKEARTKAFQELEQELIALRAKVGQPRYRTEKSLTRSINARLKKSSVGRFMQAKVITNDDGQLDIHWEVDTFSLWKAEEKDGRYLLVTNNYSISPAKMLKLYRSKDGGEKNFLIAKNDLEFSPIRLHKDSRIEGLLLINMIALLSYRLLERQTRLASSSRITTQHIIEQLNHLAIVETTFVDGSCSCRLTDPTPKQLALLQTLAVVLQDLNLIKRNPLPPALNDDKTIVQLDEVCCLL